MSRTNRTLSVGPSLAKGFDLLCFMEPRKPSGLQLAVRGLEAGFVRATGSLTTTFGMFCCCLSLVPAADEAKCGSSARRRDLSPDAPGLNPLSVCLSVFPSACIDYVHFMVHVYATGKSASPDKMACYWEVKIEAFAGVRLEIGVATRRSIYRGGCNKEEVSVCLLYHILWYRCTLL